MEALSSRGYRTYEARSGTEALDVLKRKVIDLMVTDAIMPGMSGAELMVTSGYTVTEMSFADTPRTCRCSGNPIISQNCITWSRTFCASDVSQKGPQQGVDEIRTHQRRYVAAARNLLVRPHGAGPAMSSFQRPRCSRARACASQVFVRCSKKGITA